MKKILIIQGHPHKNSFVNALAETYADAATVAGHMIKFTQLSDIEANMIHWKGYKHEDGNLESDLLLAQKDILWADHLVFAYPNWWSSAPALLKAYFERTLTPHFAFKYQEKGFPKKLLKNKTARLIVTMDTPPFLFNLLVGHKAVKKHILGFCGISPVKPTNIGPVKSSSMEQRNKWLMKVEALGKQGI